MPLQLQRNSKLFYQLLEILRPWLRKMKLPSFSIVTYFSNQLELSSKISKIPLHQLIHERNSRLSYQLLEIFLQPTWINFNKRQNAIAIAKKFQIVLPTSGNINTLTLGAKLPLFSVVKYFCNQLELTLKRDKIQLHQLIHERNSRIFYQLLEILTPRLWERSCHRFPSSNISPTNLNYLQK